MERRQVPEIKASEVQEALRNGVTRFKADDEGFGSIEEKYNLTPSGVRRLFQEPELKGLKTTFPEFTYVNDIPAGEVEETPDEVHEEQPQALTEEQLAQASVVAANPEYSHLKPEESVVEAAKTMEKQGYFKEEKKEVTIFE